MAARKKLSPAESLIAHGHVRALPELTPEAREQLQILIDHNAKQTGLRPRVGKERAIKMLATAFDIHVGRKSFMRLIEKNFGQAW